MPPNTNPEWGGEDVIDEAFVLDFACELVADFPGCGANVEQLLATDLSHEVKAAALLSIREVALDQRARAYATVRPETVSEWPIVTAVAAVEKPGSRTLRAWIAFTNYLEDYNRQSAGYRLGVLGGTALAGMGLIDALNTGLHGVDPVANRPVAVASFMIGVSAATIAHQKLHRD